MRKYILIALSAVFMATSGVAYAADPTIAGWDNKSKYAQQAGQGGTRQTVTLKLVRYAAGEQNAASILSGDAVVYSTVSDDGISVTRSSTSADGAFAGIAVTTILTADTAQNSPYEGWGKRNWGWIQVHGKVVANVTAGGGNGAAVGDFFITSSDAGQITTIVNRTSEGEVNAGSLREVAAKGGFFMDSLASDASSTSVDVFVNVE